MTQFLGNSVSEYFESENYHLFDSAFNNSHIAKRDEKICLPCEFCGNPFSENELLLHQVDYIEVF